MSQRLGRYETIRQIASGGMATVFLGKVQGEGGFERLVALKVMHPHIASDPDFVAMFLDEARLAARIRHPNVVATIDIQKSDERMFLVMEYIEGAALSAIRRHLRKQRRTIPLPIMLRIMLDTLDGLHAAHELTDDYGQALNLVHRDVSPQNILIGKDGVARITDFGVARAEARISSTRGGQLKGKLPYMPPEQILSQKTDRRADVYAAGVVLWELLVGRRLFNAPNEGAMVHDIVSGELSSPHDKRPEVPKAISDVCMRAIARKPADRFATAAVLADALEDAAVKVGIRPARPRKVGTFIESVRAELPADHPQMAPPGTPATPGDSGTVKIDSDGLLSQRPGSISPPSIDGSPDSAVPGSAAPDSVAPGPISMSPPSLPLSTPGTRTEAVIPSLVPSDSGRSQRSMLAVGAIAALLTGAVIAVAISSGSGPDPGDAAAAQESQASETSATDSTATDSTGASAQDAAGSTKLAVTPAPSAQPSTSASASKTQPPPPATGLPPRPPSDVPATPNPAPWTKPVPTPPAPAPTTTGTNYRPDGL